MSEETEPKLKNLIDDYKINLTFKELIGLGSFLIYLGIAIAGYYNLKEQVASTAKDFDQMEKDINGIIRNLDVIQIKQDESINKLNDVANKLNDVDRKIDELGYGIGTIVNRKK
jgi:hypothetical protein